MGIVRAARRLLSRSRLTARCDAAHRGRAGLRPRLGALHRAAGYDHRNADLWRLGAIEGAAGQIRVHWRQRLRGCQAAAGTQGVAAMANALRTLQEYGQSVWLDFVSRDLLNSGELTKLIAEDGLRGVTSNPSIF